MNRHPHTAIRRGAGLGVVAMTILLTFTALPTAPAASASPDRVVGKIKVKAAATHVSVDRQGTYAYVSLITKSLDVIAIASQKEAFSIPLTAYPDVVAIAPNNRKLYVGVHPNDYGLGPRFMTDVVNVSKRRVAGTITKCRDFQSPAMSPDGTLVYIPCGVTDSVYVVNSATNKVVKEILTGIDPKAAASSPDGGRLYVTNGSSDSVSVLDTRQGVEITTWPTCSGPSNVVVSPDGGRIYVACYSLGAIWAIDTSSGHVLAKIPSTEPGGMALSADGSRLYAAVTGIDVIDTSTNTKLGNIPVKGQDLLDLAVLPDDKTVYAVAEDPFIYVVNVAGFNGQ